MASEFSLIDRHFTRPVAHTVLGVGDDGAIIKPSAGMQLVVSTDMLVANTHFLPGTDPASLGWKVLAVNVSDIAAMGGTPRWALLAAALPEADESWLAAFSDGLFACANTFGIDIVGGDTTRGPMNFCVTILGEVEPGQALLRSGARAGDDIWVSGIPGRAALGLAHLQGRCVLDGREREECLSALHRPVPRVAVGRALRGIASAAIDVSDGLLADLRHILEGSGLAARIRYDKIPLALPAGAAHEALLRDCVLAGGDDYELLFCVPRDRSDDIALISKNLTVPFSCIGRTEAGAAGGLTLVDAENCPMNPDRLGYDHFG